MLARGSVKIYEGEEISGVCYMQSGRIVNWLYLTKVCMVPDEGSVITYEKDRDGNDRLVGVCNGDFETRPFEG